MSTTFVKGVAAGAVASMVLLATTTAMAGTGTGGVFNLGRTNKVSRTTVLTGKVAGAQLAVANSSTSTAATGISITVAKGRPPLKVNSSTQVANLNATYLQGRRAADFLGATAKAADSARLGGVAASGYLTTAGTAANSAKLGGVAASAYARLCSDYSAAAPGGAVLAKAFVDDSAVSTTSFTQAGVTGGWVCTGEHVLAKRTSAGRYAVVFGDVVHGDSQGFTDNFQGVLLATPATQGLRATVEGPYQCASSPPPYVLCFEVYLEDAAGNPGNGSFHLAMF